MVYNKIKAILENPFVVISSVVLGLAIGIYSPSLGATLDPYGKAFMALLEMSLIPIIVTAIGLAISQLFTFQHKEQYLGRIVLVLLAMMFGASALSFLVAFLVEPATGVLESQSQSLKEITIAASFMERTMADPILGTEVKPFAAYIIDAIPRNIFSSLASSKTFQILFFSIIIGVAVAYLKKDQRQKTENFFETTLSLFQKIILAITVWLPFAVFCLMAGGAGSVGLDTLTEMGGFILKVYSGFFILFIVSTLIIQWKTGRTFLETIKFLKEPIFIAFGTRSAVIPIPATIRSFEQRFKLDSNLTKLLVPIGAVLGRFGNIAYFAFLTVFVAGIYQVEMSATFLIGAISLSVLAGLSTTGATGILTLSLLTVVLDPLQLPAGAVLPLLIAIDTIIDPMRTLTSVYTNCAVVSLVAPKQNGGAKGKVKY